MYGDDNFNLLFPIQKIDQEKRIVTGIATADNVDLAGEQMDFDGSLDAFESWVGNIREMHDPKSSVGKLVNWKPVEVIHKGVPYNAIEVSVYISKGAQNTWEKVKDGTLRGFSIGGATIEKQKVYDATLRKSVTRITKYYLGELSLVDNPCNPAGTFTMVKSAPDGSLAWVEGALDSPVNYCATDRYTLTDGNDVCPICAVPMVTIGYVESLDNKVIAKAVTDYEIQKGLKMTEKELQINKDAGSLGSMDMTDDMKKSMIQKFSDWLGLSSPEDLPDLTVGGTGAQDMETNPNLGDGTVTDATAAENETSETASEESGEDEMTDLAAVPAGSVINININKGIAEVVEEVETIEKVAPVIEAADETVVTDEVTEKEDNMDIEKAAEVFGALLDEKLAKVTADFDEKIAKSVAAVEEKNEATLTEVKDEIEKVASSGAIKKSVEDAGDDEVDKIEKSAPVESFWGGVFVSRDLANTLGYES